MIRIFLSIAALSLMWVFSDSLRAQTKVPTLPEGRAPRQAEGVGETEEAARQDAYQQAVKAVKLLMAQNDPPLQSLAMTPEYVRTHLLIDKGHPGKDLHIEVVDKPFKKWIVTFRTDTNWWKDIVQRDQEAERHLRAEERQTIAYRVVFGLALLLLSGFGYVRLNEYTQGRYATWLRVAGVGVASLAAVGWLWSAQGG